MLKRVTLRDIAAKADVHYSTVSMALRDHPRISKDVIAKIKSIAEEMGYTPDAALSALNAYRKTKLSAHYQSTLAWIDNWPAGDSLRNAATFNEYFLGASERARQLGYEVEEFHPLKDNISPDQLSRILRNRGIKGLLLAPQFHAGTQLPLAYEWFSTVTFGYSLKPRLFHLVTNHQPHSSDLAFDNLRALGYRRIGLFLHEDHDNKVENAYLKGHWLYHYNNPEEFRVDPCLVKVGESDRGAFIKWFKKNSPDVVLHAGATHSVLEWVESLGKKVPEDVGVAHLTVAENEAYYSGVYESGRLIGQTAVDFLVGMLQRGEQGPPPTPIRILVEGSWKPGQTVIPQAPRETRSPRKRVKRVG